MKNKIYKLALAITSLSLLGGCADKGLLEYTVDKPESIAQFEYLNAYSPLKSYVDRAASPNFTLGSGITVSEFLQHGLVYSLATSNFDIVTAGNAMKYASVVADDGSMNFSTISEFVELARKGGIDIYGHTLCWHSQQNKNYLDGLIADREIEVDPEEANKALRIYTSEAKGNSWDWQMFYNLSQPLVVGQEYTIKMQLKASSAMEVLFWPKNESDTQYLPSFVASENFAESAITFTANFALDQLVFCFGTFGGELFFDDLSLVATGSDENLIKNPSFDNGSDGWSKVSWHDLIFEVVSMAAGPTTWWTNLVVNPTVEEDNFDSYYATQSGVGPDMLTTANLGAGANGSSRSVIVRSGDNPPNAWDTQFFVTVDRQFKAGDAYRFSMKAKADKTATIESQSHNNPGGYLHYQMIGTPVLTPEWQEITVEGVISAAQAGDAGMNTIAFNLSVLPEANVYYFDEMEFSMQESGNTLPMDPEEKKEVLSLAMETWVKGMMEACDGYVTQWDVVNEVVAGADYTGDGYYDLWTADRVSATDAASNFYWRDYLGDYDVVRLPIKYARQYFAENGGVPSDLKLFVNDYNLESDWDDNKKVKALIEWVKRWESDGETVIDGIGSQMHVSCYENPDAQARKEAHVVKMLELMAASGKLVRITELDMGYVDANGTAVMTKDMSFEQHQRMADYYTFIVQKYKEIIPVTQQSGITHWCPTDSPEGSGWRKGEPVGLWTLDYARKPAYGGIADGLSNAK